MPAKKFIVELDGAERERLNALISKGKAPAKTILNARVLLQADQAEDGPGWLDAQIVKALDTNLTMVSRVRETFVIEGLDAVLTRKKRETPPVPAIFDGEAQTKLTALACSQPPEGHARWTIRRLAEHVVERRIVPGRCATGMAELGISRDIRERGQNQVTGRRQSIGSRHDQYEYADEKRRALALWQGGLLEIVEGARSVTGAVDNQHEVWAEKRAALEQCYLPNGLSRQPP